MIAKGQIESYSVADILYVTECKQTKNVMLIAGGSQCVIFYSITFQKFITMNLKWF